MLKVSELKLRISSGEVLQESLSFSINDGQLLVLEGKNGSGKSTFLRQLAQEELTRKLDSNCQKISYLPQLAGRDFVIPLAVHEIVDFDRFNSELIQLSDQLGVNLLKTSLFNQLSGAERQKLLLLKVLSEEHDLLILDEPFNHLDDKSISLVAHYLRESLKDFGLKNIVLVTHNRLGLGDFLTEQLVTCQLK